MRSLLDGTVLPTMRRRYATAPLRIREAFVVKYEAAAAPPPADGALADAQGTHATAARSCEKIILLQPDASPTPILTMRVSRRDAINVTGRLSKLVSSVSRPPNLAQMPRKETHLPHREEKAQ